MPKDITFFFKTLILEAIKKQKLLKGGNYTLFMDKAYGYNKTLVLAKDHWFRTVVSTKKNRKSPWRYDKQLYKQSTISSDILIFSEIKTL